MDCRLAGTPSSMTVSCPTEAEQCADAFVSADSVPSCACYNCNMLQAAFSSAQMERALQSSVEAAWLFCLKAGQGSVPVCFSINTISLLNFWGLRRAAVDVKLHEYLLKSPQRQMDPDKASIFFVPVYLAKLFNWFWTRQHCTTRDQDPLSCMKEPNVRTRRACVPCHYKASTAPLPITHWLFM